MNPTPTVAPPRDPAGPITPAPATRAVLPGRTLRNRWFSVRIRPRALSVCSLLAAAVAVVGAWSISVGDFPIPMTDVIATLFGQGSEDADFIVRTLRLPRVLNGILVGAAFGMAGAIFQSLARNPLGSPDIIGFDSGAALGAVIVIVSFGGTSAQVAVGAVGGGLVTALAVFFFAWQRGVKAHRLVLVGIGIGFAAASVVDYLITRAEINDVQRAAVWLTGSLNGSTWSDVRTAAIALAVLGPIAVLCQRWLDRLELGDDAAAGLGVPVTRAKLAIVVVGVGLSSLAVAAAGPVGFVAFVAGPIARRLVRSPGACIVPAAFVGALVVVAADLAARRVLAPTELPVGIMTSIIGAPYLLWLLTRQIRTGGL
ncbi:MAG: FecCD family ABC transporter permease [Acidimicrobiales bacterium]